MTFRRGYCISWAESCRSVLRNDHKVSAQLEYRTLCEPSSFAPLSSIAYRLARATASDAITGVSPVPVSANDLGGGHAVLIGVGWGLLNQEGKPVVYDSESTDEKTSLRCFTCAFRA